MKKLIIGMALAAACATNADTIRIQEKNADGVLVTNEYDAIAYCDKIIAEKDAGKSPTVWTTPNYAFLINVVTPEVVAECDTKLSAKHFYITHNAFKPTKFPKMFENYAKVYAECTAPDIAVPDVVPLTQSYISDPKAWDVDIKLVMINLYVEIFRAQLVSDVTIKRILNVAPKAIRHQIRKEGSSFVEKDGINPVQVRIDMLSKALNAPRLSGLNAAIKTCGMDYGLDFESKLLPEAEVETLKTDILNGDVGFTVQAGYRLRTHMGIDAYNAFVKLYNGEK